MVPNAILVSKLKDWGGIICWLTYCFIVLGMVLSAAAITHMQHVLNATHYSCMSLNSTIIFYSNMSHYSAHWHTLSAPHWEVQGWSGQVSKANQRPANRGMHLPYNLPEIRKRRGSLTKSCYSAGSTFAFEMQKSFHLDYASCPTGEPVI